MQVTRDCALSSVENLIKTVGIQGNKMRKRKQQNNSEQLPFTETAASEWCDVQKSPTAMRIPKRENVGFLVLWNLFMSLTQVALLAFENTYNKVVASIFLVLTVSGLQLERLVIARARYRLSSILVVVIQVVLLFGIMTIIACTKKVNSPIDEVAWKFLWVKDKEKVFGSMFEAEHVFAFVLPIYFRALKTSIGLAIVAAAIQWTSIQRDHVIIISLKTLCRRILQMVLILAGGFALAALFLDRKQQASLIEKNEDESCTRTKPPPVHFQSKPNIIVLTIDSWRKDTVGIDSMPRTLKWLNESKPGLSLLDWKTHDSCAVQSDQGYAALHYGMKGLNREKLRQFKNNPDIQSWLLEAFRKNDYQMHKVTPDKYDFCWLLMENCDLFTRGYDSQNGVNSTEVPYRDKYSIWKDGGSSVVFEGMEALLKEQHQQTNAKPIFISADLQDLHHPLSYTERSHIVYNEPVLSQSDIHKTYSGAIQITPENKADIVLKLRNRVKNCLLNLDDNMGNWLQRVKPFLNNTILILTGDHSELLFDTDENLIWHGVKNPIDLQRRVPMFMHGPRDILSTLQVSDQIVTCHSDVLPSLLEALSGKKLEKRWKEELDYNSYYSNGNGKAKTTKTLPKGFAYHSIYQFHVLLDGNQRLYLYDDTVKEAHLLDSNETIPPEEVKKMTQKIHEIEGSNWPGWNSDNCMPMLS